MEEKQRRTHFSNSPAMMPVFQHTTALSSYSCSPANVTLEYQASKLSQAQASDTLLLTEVCQEAAVGGQYARKKNSQKILCL